MYQLPEARVEAVRLHDEPEESFYRRVVYNNGWNACREAMLAGAPVSRSYTATKVKSWKERRQEGNSSERAMLDQIADLEAALKEAEAHARQGGAHG